MTWLTSAGYSNAKTRFAPQKAYDFCFWCNCPLERLLPTTSLHNWTASQNNLSKNIYDNARSHTKIRPARKFKSLILTHSSVLTKSCPKGLSLVSGLEQWAITCGISVSTIKRISTSTTSSRILQLASSKF